MKKLFLLSICAGLGMSAYAQSSSLTRATNSHETIAPRQLNATNPGGRATSYNDTEYMTNGVYNNLLDTPTLYYFSLSGVATDSGFYSGTNGYGFSEFAERYEFNSADSTIEVAGVLALFAGTVNPSSTNNAMMYVWNAGAPVVVRSTFQYSGFPGTGLDSVSVPFLDLGINASADTFKTFLFTTPTAFLTSTFFVGYTLNYTWGATNGDTIGLQETIQGERTTAPAITVASGDTTVNDQAVCYVPVAGGWFDNGYDLGLMSDYYIFPLVIANVTESVKGITKNNLTFFGNYPNPASDMTNIKFSLANNTDVTITIMDMSGHTINVMNESNLSAGVNVIPVNTSALASGDYIYLVRTTANTGIAGKMTIIK